MFKKIIEFIKSIFGVKKSMQVEKLTIRDVKKDLKGHSKNQLIQIIIGYDITIKKIMKKYNIKDLREFIK